jgi:hypothetical protein
MKAHDVEGPLLRYQNKVTITKQPSQAQPVKIEVQNLTISLLTVTYRHGSERFDDLLGYFARSPKAGASMKGEIVELDIAFDK